MGEGRGAGCNPQPRGHCGGSLEKTLKLGKIEGRRRRGQQNMRWLDGIVDMYLSKLQEIVKDREAWHASVHGAAKVKNNRATEQQ